MMSGKNGAWGGMCIVHKIAAALVFVGALNWGLIGLFNWNLVNALLGSWPTVERIVYVLVGLAAVAMLFMCKCCMKGGMGGSCGMGCKCPKCGSTSCKCSACGADMNTMEDKKM